MPSPSRASSGVAADAITDALLTASRLLVGLSIRSIAAVNDSITIAQFRMLVVVRTQGKMKLSVLAEQLGVNPSTATRMIDRLIGAGLVDRRINPESRREVVVDLTDTGAAVVAKVMQQRRREIARIVAKMPDRHRLELVRALEAFSEAGGEPPAGTSEDWI